MCRFKNRPFDYPNGTKTFEPQVVSDIRFTPISWRLRLLTVFPQVGIAFVHSRWTFFELLQNPVRNTAELSMVAYAAAVEIRVLSRILGTITAILIHDRFQ